MMVTGCGNADEAAPNNHLSPSVRVASLSPGISATIVALGAHDRLVGRTPWCAGIDAIPVVGTLLDLNAEALLRANPTIVLVQPPAQGSTVDLDELASRHGWLIERFRIESLDDIRALVSALPSVLAARDDGAALASLRLRAELLNRELDEQLAPLDAASSHGRVLLLLAGGDGAEALGFGSDTYLGEFLTRIGADNAIEGRGYPALSAEDIVRLAPHTVVLFGPRPQRMIEQLSTTTPAARLLTLNAPQLMQPGGGMIDGLKSLRALLAKRSSP